MCVCSNDYGPDGNDIKHRDRSSSAPVNGSLESKKDDDKKEVRAACSSPMGQEKRERRPVRQCLCTRMVSLRRQWLTDAGASALVCVRGTRALTSVATDFEALGRETRRARETRGMGSGARILKREKAMKTGARRLRRRVQVRLSTSHSFLV